MVRTASVPSDSLRDTGDPAWWQNLNGLWEWEPVVTSAECCEPIPIPDVPPPPFGRTLNGSILVPFPMESCLSGVAPLNVSSFHRAMWYRLTFTLNVNSSTPTGVRSLLHFGAVDWQSSFWVNGENVANHTGGYDEIVIDITNALDRKPAAAALHELLVYVYDPSELGFQPKGKQSIFKHQDPGGGQYTSTTGIWQTVWLELVPAAYISAISLGQNSSNTLTVSARVMHGGQISANHDLVVFRAFKHNERTVIATATAAAGTVARLQIPTPRQWGPEDPYLYDITVTLTSAESGPDSAVLDSVVGYFGLRTIRVGRAGQPGGGQANVTRPLLNDKAVFFAGWLDQSWWPDGQYTAPSDDALAYDILAVSMFGLNMVRLHMKVNPERYYYHADKRGVAVFQDMPQVFVKPESVVPEAIPAFVADLSAMILGRMNHPSILQFTLTNEDDCWNMFNSTASYSLPKLLALARSLAPHHLIDMNSGGSFGWQNATKGMKLGDVIDYHTYPSPQRIPSATETRYAMVGEFGGAGAYVSAHNWGKCFSYLELDTPSEEAEAYINMTKILFASGDVSASVYTQITDVEDECDGFLNYDRTNKFSDEDTAKIRAANQALIRSRLRGT